MDNRAGEMQVFLRVVETSSFSEAARQLLMTLLICTQNCAG